MMGRIAQGLRPRAQGGGTRRHAGAVAAARGAGTEPTGAPVAQGGKRDAAFPAATITEERSAQPMSGKPTTEDRRRGVAAGNRPPLDRPTVRREMAGILEVLEEIALAEADADWYEPPIPVIHVGERILGLLGKLRQELRMDKDSPFVPDAPGFAQPPAAKGAPQRTGEELLQQLEEIAELTGSLPAGQPSWADIETRFRRFVQAYDQHRPAAAPSRQAAPRDRTG
jgi:hypothetical protein